MKMLPMIMGAAVAMAVPSVAHAVTIDPGTTVTTALDDGSDAAFKIGFSAGGLTNPFEEFLNFTTTVGGFLSITATTIANFSGGPNDTDFTSVTLIGPNGSTDVPQSPFSTDINEVRALANLAIAPGSYSLRITGTPGSDNGSFGGDLSFVALQSAVPEPSTWAMMLIGFGLVGGAMRRRAKVARRVSFAF